MTSPKDLIKAAKLPERIVPVCLRPDLNAQMQDLERQLAEAQRQASNSLAGTGERAFAEQIEALHAEMVEHSITLRMRAVPRRRWTSLLTEHPPREGSQGDKLLGINEVTFFDALIRECTVEPDLDAEDWDRLLGEVLSSAQYDAMSNAAWSLNRQDVDIPFSHAASTVLRSSASG